MLSQSRLQILQTVPQHLIDRAKEKGLDAFGEDVPFQCCLTWVLVATCACKASIVLVHSAPQLELSVKFVVQHPKGCWGLGTAGKGL